MRALTALLVLVAACDYPRSARPGGDDALPVDANHDGELPAPPDAMTDGPPDAPDGPCGELTATLRDFKVDHPDFQVDGANDRGLVETMLGGDRKPVYAPLGSTQTVTSAATFNQWYRDVVDVNLAVAHPLIVAETTPGVFVFDDSTFFPLDGLGWDDVVLGHNFYFTTEVHAAFVYRGGESFTFTGDDDVFVFVNGRLAIDLGGAHVAQTSTIDLDAAASSLGLTVGNRYAIDLFHAERAVSDSTFRIATSIDCLIDAAD